MAWDESGASGEGEVCERSGAPATGATRRTRARTQGHEETTLTLCVD